MFPQATLVDDRSSSRTAVRLSDLQLDCVCTRQRCCVANDVLFARQIIIARCHYQRHLGRHGINLKHGPGGEVEEPLSVPLLFCIYSIILINHHGHAQSRYLSPIS